MTNQKNGTLYIGITSDLIKRVYEHKASFVDGFTKTYNLKNLVYYEIHEDINAALLREKQLKKWNRDWKIEIIEKENPNWVDLYSKLI